MPTKIDITKMDKNKQIPLDRLFGYHEGTPQNYLSLRLAIDITKRRPDKDFDGQPKRFLVFDDDSTGTQHDDPEQFLVTADGLRLNAEDRHKICIVRNLDNTDFKDQFAKLVAAKGCGDLLKSVVMEQSQLYLFDDYIASDAISVADMYVNDRAICMGSFSFEEVLGLAKVIRAIGTIYADIELNKTRNVATEKQTKGQNVKKSKLTTPTIKTIQGRPAQGQEPKTI